LCNKVGPDSSTRHQASGGVNLLERPGAERANLGGSNVLARSTWSEIKPGWHRFEQAFSDDGGKTWETNRIYRHRRIGG
jgi:hypothetical protein